MPSSSRSCKYKVLGPDRRSVFSTLRATATGKEETQHNTKKASQPASQAGWSPREGGKRGCHEEVDKERAPTTVARRGIEGVQSMRVFVSGLMPQAGGTQKSQQQHESITHPFPLPKNKKRYQEDEQVRCHTACHFLLSRRAASLRLCRSAYGRRSPTLVVVAQHAKFIHHGVGDLASGCWSCSPSKMGISGLGIL